jgi:hypothetical protein
VAADVFRARKLVQCSQMTKRWTRLVLWQHGHQKELTAVRICNGLKIAFIFIFPHSNILLQHLKRLASKTYKSDTTPVLSLLSVVRTQGLYYTALGRCTERSSIICAVNHQNEHIKENEIGGTCSAHEKWEKGSNCWFLSLNDSGRS